MKIRNRLSIISSIIFGVIFTIASALVYLTFYKSSERVIFNELQKSCLLTAHFYLEEDELPYAEHQKIKKRFDEEIVNHEVRIYNESNIIRYGETTPDPAVTAQILTTIRQQGKHNFKSDGYYYSGIFYPDNQGDFVVVLNEENIFFEEQSQQLLIIMIAILIVGLLAIILLSKALSSIAYRPITRVIDQVNKIESESINQPIQTLNTNDEVQALIETFNNMLHRLSETFTVQKNFINYVSHEIKTPLAAISGSLEVFAQKDRTPDEYEKVANDAIENVEEIKDILHNMMVISGLKKEDMHSQQFRVDEVIWEIMDKIKELCPSQSLQVNLDIPPENENLLSIQGSRTQLFMAIFNLVENAVKYSEEEVEIVFYKKMNCLAIDIVDKGKGIPTEEQDKIKQPFFRGSNIKDIKGSGIGLSVAEIILKNYNIDLVFNSHLNKGTIVSLFFPKKF